VGKQKTHLADIELMGLLMWQDYWHDPGGGVIQKKKPVVRFAHQRVFCLLQTSCEHGFVSNKKARHCRAQAFSFVGVAGFEPATLWSQTIFERTYIASGFDLTEEDWLSLPKTKKRDLISTRQLIIAGFDKVIRSGRNCLNL
jgi:hypothetical protein